MGAQSRLKPLNSRGSELARAMMAFRVSYTPSKPAGFPLLLPLTMICNAPGGAWSCAQPCQTAATLSDRRNPDQSITAPLTAPYVIDFETHDLKGFTTGETRPLTPLCRSVTI